MKVNKIVKIVLGIVIIGAGYLFWRISTTEDIKDTTLNGSTVTTTDETTSEEKSDDKLTADKSTFSLADGAITFDTPPTWTDDGVGCIKDAAAYSNAEYLDSVRLLPGEELRTIYGDGTEYFYVNVCVFENVNDLEPEVWFSNAGAGGIGSGIRTDDDEDSSNPINGYPAYYRKQKSGYEEVSYVLSVEEKIVYVRARTFDTHEDLPGVGDFRKFESPIKELVSTIR